MPVFYLFFKPGPISEYIFIQPVKAELASTPHDSDSRDRKLRAFNELQKEFDALSSGALLWSSRARSPNFETNNFNFDNNVEPSCLSYFYFHRNYVPGER